jgi:hypothetical protein
MRKSHNSCLSLGEYPMAMNVFLLLDCIGLVFPIYALVNFWKEGRRYKHSRHSALPCDQANLGGRIAVIPAVFLCPKDHGAVIPFPARNRQINISSEHAIGFAKTIEMRRRVVSEQSAGLVRN